MGTKIKDFMLKFMDWAFRVIGWVLLPAAIATGLTALITLGFIFIKNLIAGL